MYNQIFYFSYQSTMSQVVHFMIISQILSCTLAFFLVHWLLWSDD